MTKRRNGPNRSEISPNSVAFGMDYAEVRERVHYGQDAQLSQRDRAAGCVIVFAKSRRLELGDNILRTL